MRYRRLIIMPLVIIAVLSTMALIANSASSQTVGDRYTARWMLRGEPPRQAHGRWFAKWDKASTAKPAARLSVR